MICAFEDIADLNHCMAEFNLESDHRQQDGMLIVRAEHFDESCEENNFFFYAMFLAKDKVSVIEDGRTMAELAQSFPQVPREQLEKVWAAQETWNGCFDVLRSLMSSHHSFVMTDCDFVFDNVFWPPLRASLTSSAPTTPRSGVLSEGGDWSVIDITSELSGIEISSDEKPKKATTSTADGDAISDWEFLQEPAAIVDVSVLAPCVIDSSTSTTSLRTKRSLSYKDILITGATCTQLKVQRAELAKPLQTFRPALVVVGPRIPNRRVGRTYVMDAGAASQLRADGDDDFDDEFYDPSEYYQSIEFVKGKVAATRFRAVNMLRPAIQEKKLQRIAMKGGAVSL